MKGDVIDTFFQLIRRFPSSAERVVTVLANSGAKPIPYEFIGRTAGLGAHEKVRLPEILNAMARSNIASEVAPGFWVSNVPERQLRDLALQLLGAATYQRVHKDKDVVSVVLTLPEESSKLCEALPHQGPYCVKLGATDSAFTRLAKEAKFRFVILTPFLDKTGAEWLAKLFLLTADRNVERILILRDYHAVKGLLSRHATLLDSLSVKIYDYLLYRDPSRLTYETFHAKVLLCDDTMAYVGSANMLASSLEVALEVGLTVEGNSVLDISRLMQSILAVAKPISA